MRNYDGIRVDYNEIDSKAEQINKYKLSAELAGHIEETWEKQSLSDSDINQLESRSLKVIEQPFTSGSKVVTIVLIFLFFVLPIALFLMNITAYALIATLIAVIVLVYTWIADKSLRRTERYKLDALRSNGYAAYTYKTPERKWCVCSVKDGDEEQDHTTMDDEGYLYDFYIVCGKLVFAVEEDEYKAISDKLSVVLFKHNKKTIYELLIT